MALKINQYVDKFTLPDGSVHYVRDKQAHNAIVQLSNGKQDVLTAGDNIVIDDNGRISASSSLSSFLYVHEDNESSDRKGNVFLNNATTASIISPSSSKAKWNHIEGENNILYAGNNNHLEGYNNKIGTDGTNTTTLYAAHAEGNSNIVLADHAHVEGLKNIAVAAAQHVGGQLNSPNASYIEIIGNGTTYQNNGQIAQRRSNARVMDWAGNTSFAGSITAQNGTFNGNIMAAAAQNDTQLPTLGQVKSLIPTDSDTTYTFVSTIGSNNTTIGIKNNNNGLSTITLLPVNATQAGLMSTSDKVALDNLIASTVNLQNKIIAGRNVSLSTADNNTTIDVSLDGLSFKYFKDGADNQGAMIGNIAENKALGSFSLAEGNQTSASGAYSHAQGTATSVTANSAHGQGYGTTASSVYSHAQGRETLASSYASHAEGYRTVASGTHAHTEGAQTTASGQDSHAQGINTLASGQYSHAEGSATSASGLGSHTGGRNTASYVSYGFSHGYGLTNSTTCPQGQVIFGKYNVNSTTAAFIIGQGTGTNSRKNIFTVSTDGKVTARANGISGYDLITYDQLNTSLSHLNQTISSLATSVTRLQTRVAQLEQRLGIS